jgi:arabinan endo-1,5-alpha-L-arabinosidase
MFLKTLQHSLFAIGALCACVETYAAVSNGTYLISSQVSGKPVEVASASTANAADVLQWSDS